MLFNCVDSTIGIEAPHGVEVDSGCYEEELQGYTLEVCFCQDPMCNTAGHFVVDNLAVVAMVFSAMFIL